MAARSASGSTKDRKTSSKATGKTSSKSKGKASKKASGKPAGPKASGDKSRGSRSKKAAAGGSKNTWKSRAVLRLIEAGSTAECPHCTERVKFRARHRDQQVICNVYVDGVWNRVEQYHAECYDDAGSPHGKAAKKQ